MAKRTLEEKELHSTKRQCVRSENSDDTAYFVFFDTETDGRGSFRRPFTQTVVQVSWTVTDKAGCPLENFTSFVKGATALDFNPNGWSVEEINENGIEPLEARNKFIEAVNRINKNNGYLVAHNINFDMDAIKSLGVPRSLFKKVFCTKDNTTNICCIPDKRGFKWPKQTELYNFLFPDWQETKQTHDASDDVHMLMENFWECWTRAQSGNPVYSAFLFA